MQRFCLLFDLIMPESFHQRGYMPVFVGGLPSKVWIAMRRNADSRLYMFAMFPNVDIIDRALGTFDLEASFSEVVRGTGQYKPYVSTCMQIMGKIDYLWTSCIRRSLSADFSSATPIAVHGHSMEVQGEQGEPYWRIGWLRLPGATGVTDRRQRATRAD